MDGSQAQAAEQMKAAQACLQALLGKAGSVQRKAALWMESAGALHWTDASPPPPDTSRLQDS